MYIGNDEGKIYGALIAGAGEFSSTHQPPDKRGRINSGRKRTRKRRRRNQKKVVSADDNKRRYPFVKDSVSSTEISKSSEDSNIRQVAIDERHSDDIELVDKDTPPTNVSSGQQLRDSLGLLVTYSDSSSVSDGSNSDESPGMAKRHHNRYPIPTVVQDMFVDNTTSEEPGKEGIENFESDESDNLGYFEPVSTSEDDDDVTYYDSNLLQREKDLAVAKHWSEKKAQWVYSPSMLSSYTCWKCSNVGHLAQDCTVAVVRRDRNAEPKSDKITRTLQSIYATCREIKKKKEQRCTECGVHSNLACCLDCG